MATVRMRAHLVKGATLVTQFFSENSIQSPYDTINAIRDLPQEGVFWSEEEPICAPIKRYEWHIHLYHLPKRRQDIAHMIGLCIVTHIPGRLRKGAVAETRWASEARTVVPKTKLEIQKQNS